MSDSGITSILQEERQFPPTAEFSAQAHVKSMKDYEALYKKADENIEGFWAEQAESLHWFKKWDKVLEWNRPFAKWFVGGKFNVSYNCLDRHLSTWRKNKAALIWEGEPGDVRTFTYQQLHQEVSQFANVLKAKGIEKGDRIAIYMPMIPELAISLLACARIGATHTVIFGGFSAESIKDRLEDSHAKMVITSDGGFRRGEAFALKEKVDEAVQGATSVETVIVVKRTGQQVKWSDKIDCWYHDLMKEASTDCPAEPLDSEHPLFLLYTSGTTGKPKGIQHSSAGYLLGASYSHKMVFDIKDEDTYWCTADIGWITGHSYIVYGPLANGATSLMYEGVPNHPDKDRFWAIIEKHKVNVFYTAPTAIRTFVKWGEEFVNRHDLSSLRLLGTVGEPINPEAWMWYHKVIGKEKCPIVDTWWQTETGMILISPLPGATSTIPGSCTRPLPGIDAAIVDKDGNEAPANTGGFLVIRKPWPSMLRTIWGDDERFIDTYWKRFEKNGFYFAGDGARKDPNGFFWIMGRVDDVINISGHRLGTMEVESALVSHPFVAEAAVVGRPHEIKGQAISAFVILEGINEGSKELADELRKHVAKEIGPIAKPDDIRFTNQLPKTRSGKIMRRLLKDISAGEDITGDVTTLDDPTIIKKLAMKPF